MSRRARAPETRRLPLQYEDWLLVKKHLTAGEHREMFARMMRHGVAGDQVDSVKVGLCRITAYLLDWGTFLDADGQPLVVADQSIDRVEAVLNAIDPEDFREVKEAIDLHIVEMEIERKNARDGEKTSPAISPSLV